MHMITPRQQHGMTILRLPYSTMECASITQEFAWVPGTHRMHTFVLSYLYLLFPSHIKNLLSSQQQNTHNFKQTKKNQTDHNHSYPWYIINVSQSNLILIYLTTDPSYELHSMRNMYIQSNLYQVNKLSQILKFDILANALSLLNI
jgi:hypothetical protein